MADQPITGLEPDFRVPRYSLPQMFLPIADISQSETKRVTPKDVVIAAVKPASQGGIPENSIPPSKIDWNNAAE